MDVVIAILEGSPVRVHSTEGNEAVVSNIDGSDWRVVDSQDISVAWIDRHWSDDPHHYRCSGAEVAG